MKVFPRQLVEQKKLLPLVEAETANLRHLDSKGCLKFFESFEHKGNHFLVMEFIEGVPLTELLRDELSPETKLQVMRRLNGLLLRLHAAGLSHRDIKCDNIIVGFDSATQRVVSMNIIDYGFS